LGIDKGLKPTAKLIKPLRGGENDGDGKNDSGLEPTAKLIKPLRGGENDGDGENDGGGRTVSGRMKSKVSHNSVGYDAL
jgi:hypothetical protein